MRAGRTDAGWTRREFVKLGSAGVAAATLGAGGAGVMAGARNMGGVRVGVIGCGGRGTGAAINMLEASPDTEIVALADVFADRLAGCRRELASLGDSPESRAMAARVNVRDEACFVGFDAGQRLIEHGQCDVVILATPPGFRPGHFAAAVAAGKHVFMEKPVAVDPAGVRVVLKAAAEAQARGLSVVAGTQRRHERSYLEAVKRLQDGQIGRIASARCFWNQGGLWMHKRRPEWSDAEWQLRNWLYFTWLSGDHIVEQHVHNLDVVNWVLGATPVRCLAMGGRQVRTDPAYGHIYDHFAVMYEYPGDVWVTSMCRQIEGTPGAVEEGFRGERGVCTMSPGRASVRGEGEETNWSFSGENPNPYVEEHRALVSAIVNGRPVNEAVNVAHSTMTAIMGRMSAYTGKPVTWEQAMASTLDLMPTNLEMGAMPAGEVAVPGKTPLV